MSKKRCVSEPTVAIHDGSAQVKVSKAIYAKEVLFGAAFTFLDRCYVHLDMADPEHYLVSLRPKPHMRDLSPQEVAGEFCNELVNEALRLRLAKQTEAVRTEIVKRAIGQSLRAPAPAQSPPPLPDLPPEVAKILAEEEDLDFLDDPLGIAVPWEEKYGKKEGPQGQ